MVRLSWVLLEYVLVVENTIWLIVFHGNHSDQLEITECKSIIIIKVNKLLGKHLVSHSEC